MNISTAPLQFDPLNMYVSRC